MQSPTFHFFTLVTRDDQYGPMCESLSRVGFDGTNSIFTVLDNRERNLHEPYSAVTKAVQTAQAPYVVFCHQDLVFLEGPDRLLAAIQEVERKDPKWALLGNVGQSLTIEIAANYDDPSGSILAGEIPAQVLTLDENFLVIRRESGIGCSPEMSGFHLYATDLCLNAYERGFSAYVLNFRVLHVGGTLGYPGLHELAKEFYRHWSRKIRGAVLFTPCMVFVFSRRPQVFGLTNRVGMSTRLLSKIRVPRTLDFLLRHGRPAWLPAGEYKPDDPNRPKMTPGLRALDYVLRRGRAVPAKAVSTDSR